VTTNASLVEWAEQYLRARDAFERAIVSIEKNKNGLEVTYKKKELTVLCQETLDVKAVPASGHVLLAVTQSKVNFDALVAGFKSLAQNPTLTVAFVNVKTTEKWLVKPHVHANVADPTSLKAGLQSLYETVAA